MATFSSYQDNNNNMNPFLVDSVYLKIMSGLMGDGNNMIMNTNCFSQIYPPHSDPILHQTTPCPVVHDTSGCLDHTTKEAFDDSEPSVTIKQSSDSSTVVDKLESGDQVTQTLDKKRKTRNKSSPNSAQSKDGREGKGKKQRQCNGEAKEKQHQKAKPDKKPAAYNQEPPTGYIHVRARRGQATDSHSLAERVRREKISERMKILQRLVPGCDKVTGKALMLDEIINYVQSLQNQVEFLSMKLASLNPMFYDFTLQQGSFIFSPSERLDSMQASPLPQCSQNQRTVFADTPPPASTTTTTTTTTTTPNNSYALVDSSAFSQEHQFQNNGSLLWDVEGQGQRFLNPSEFSDNFCSFN